MIAFSFGFENQRCICHTGFVECSETTIIKNNNKKKSMLIVCVRVCVHACMCSCIDRNMNVRTHMQVRG